MIGQPPCSSGRSMPSHISLVAPLRPAWPSCRQIFAAELAWTKSTMRFQAASCSSFQRPGAAGRDARVGATQVISVKISPAPPMARDAVDARGGSRRACRPPPNTCTSARPRRGSPASCRAAGTAGTSAAPAVRRRRRSPRARTCRRTPVDLGDEIRRAQAQVVVGDRLRARHQAEGELHGSKSQKRSTCSNQTSDTSAACCVFSTSSRRRVS